MSSYEDKRQLYDNIDKASLDLSSEERIDFIKWCVKKCRQSVAISGDEFEDCVNAVLSYDGSVDSVHAMRGASNAALMSQDYVYDSPEYVAVFYACKALIDWDSPHYITNCAHFTHKSVGEAGRILEKLKSYKLSAEELAVWKLLNE